MGDPIFAYMSKDSLACYRATNGRHQAMLFQNNDRELSMVRVAIAEVAPSLLDKAWAEMTPSERDTISPHWQGGRVPDGDAIIKVANYLKEMAISTGGAADKLLAAALEARAGACPYG